MQNILEIWNEPNFRSNQIRKWYLGKGCENFNEMSDLPNSLQNKLSDTFYFGSLKLKIEKQSRDGTIKRLYELNDGQLIETVLMSYADGRRTACISSQVGCGMGCKFCATGQMGFIRQLSDVEIFEQVQRFNIIKQFQLNNSKDKRKYDKISNIVFMGMGEPLANYKNVISAIRRIVTELGISPRRITISTVGIAPRIIKLADEVNLPVNLAISLHQANNIKRNNIIPMNKRYAIEDIIKACQYYIKMTNNRISFEWVLIDGVTDTYECANELGHLLQEVRPCHVNLIPLNSTELYKAKTSKTNNSNQFMHILKDIYHIEATVRVRRGIDIDAGCGQLRSQFINKCE